MSKQIAVGLSDDLVDFVDETVSSGAGWSRAAVVTRALERERRRAVAARDARLEGPSAVSCDNITTIPAKALGEQIGVLLDHQEDALADAIRAAFDLD